MSGGGEGWWHGMCTGGCGGLGRVLLGCEGAALRNEQRVVTREQRLRGEFQVRMPVDEVDRAWHSACVRNDVGGYLFLPEAERPQGRAARSDRAGAAPLQQHFNEVWDRSERASMLQKLDI